MATKKRKQRLGKLQLNWIKKLESGRYKQTREGFLRDENGYCCLGICERIEDNLQKDLDGSYITKDKSHNNIVLSKNTMKKYSFRADTGKALKEIIIGDNSYISLADMNDEGVTFKEIAEIIRENPNIFFKSSC